MIYITCNSNNNKRDYEIEWEIGRDRRGWREGTCDRLHGGKRRGKLLILF